MNQDLAIKKWREDAAKGDPKPYTRNKDAIWLRLNGNEGWYFPQFDGERLIGIAAFPFDWSGNLMKYVSSGQRKKIEEAFR